ncbi:hypothetical protein ACPUVO_03640 [Pseudocolwellia sp. HL-MZ19]|uniref:hypothetical protein n=1 Tax=Pseudocolwellia sp. HL-MZ19 TaxID=3400846 RepID=UPI003CEB6660
MKVYIDHNIINLHLKNEFILLRKSNLDWVYSNEHFDEIRRSIYPEKYLTVLKELNATYIELILDRNYRLTGEVSFKSDHCPFELYKIYEDRNKEVDFNDKLFDPFLAWINGGGEPLKLLDFPNVL